MASGDSDFCRESRNHESNSRSSTRVFRCSRILAQVVCFSTGSPPLCRTGFAGDGEGISALPGGKGSCGSQDRQKPGESRSPVGGPAHYGQEQTHVPAQQSPPEQDPWVSGPDEDQGGPGRSRPPAGERAQARLRLSGGGTRVSASSLTEEAEAASGRSHARTGQQRLPPSEGRSVPADVPRRGAPGFSRSV